MAKQVKKNKSLVVWISEGYLNMVKDFQTPSAFWFRAIKSPIKPNDNYIKVRITIQEL